MARLAIRKLDGSLLEKQDGDDEKGLDALRANAVAAGLKMNGIIFLVGPAPSDPDAQRWIAAEGRWSDPPAPPTEEEKFQAWLDDPKIKALKMGLARTSEAKKARGEPPEILPADLSDVDAKATAAFSEITGGR